MIIYLLDLDCGKDRLLEFTDVNRYASAIWRALAIDCTGLDIGSRILPIIEHKR
jgi:hypothetical protein